MPLLSSEGVHLAKMYSADICQNLGFAVQELIKILESVSLD